MSFLDSLENSLKSLESRDERDPNEAHRREKQRASALAAAPFAEQLKNGPFSKKLFEEAAIAGHRIRAKIYIAWVEDALRLEVRGRTMLLCPTGDGVFAEYTDKAGIAMREGVDLNASPAGLLNKWLNGEERPAAAPQAVEMEETL